MFNPWLETTRQGINIYLTLLSGRAACTDGQRIWLDARLTRIEATCSLTHELLHIHAGHGCTQNSAVEAKIREGVARALIPLPAILSRAQSQEHPATIAEDFNVTLPVLADRMTTLTGHERAQLRAATIPHVTA
ncbi:ImmA/IrrE family metallo-endopeptidase [Rothia sp. p3-SID1597]|nr:ImmA/IrrE family metallo-endopeptidase [Rothia sp. p3-SID1597]